MWSFFVNASWSFCFEIYWQSQSNFKNFNLIIFRYWSDGLPDTDPEPRSSFLQMYGVLQAVKYSSQHEEARVQNAFNGKSSYWILKNLKAKIHFTS